MIDRQELIAVLDQFGVRPEVSAATTVFSFREALADAILALEAPLVTDTGTMIVEYHGGCHYPKGRSPGHWLEECNRRDCGPKL